MNNQLIRKYQRQTLSMYLKMKPIASISKISLKDKERNIYPPSLLYKINLNKIVDNVIKEIQININRLFIWFLTNINRICTFYLLISLNSKFLIHLNKIHLENLPLLNDPKLHLKTYSTVKLKKLPVLKINPQQLSVKTEHSITNTYRLYLQPILLRISINIYKN